MMLVLPVACSARISAAQLIPLVTIRPTPSVRPVGTAAMLDGSRIPCRISPMPVPLTGWTKPPAGRKLPSASRSAISQLTPRSADLSTVISTRMPSSSTCARRMSRRSTMDITVRIIFGGAETISALVCGSAQMVTLLSPPPDCTAAGAGVGSAAARGGNRRGDALDLLTQLGGDLLRVGVAQVTDLRVAARLKRRVHVRDQRLESQALGTLAAHQHAVGAVVGHHLHRRLAAALRGGRGVQAVDRPHDLGGARVLQRNHVDFLVARLVDALDDARHAIHVRRAVRDDQHVRCRVGGEMAVLRDQRPQDRHQLRGADVLDGDDLRDDLVGGRTHARGQVVGGQLAGIRVRQDLDHLARRDGHEAVHLQDRQERLVEGVGRHRRRGNHRDLCPDPRIDDEVLAGDRAHRLDDLREVGVLVVGRDGSLLPGRERLPGASSASSPASAMLDSAGANQSSSFRFIVTPLGPGVPGTLAFRSPARPRAGRPQRPLPRQPGRC